MRMPGVLVYEFELGGVLDGVPVRVEEVAEGVIAGQVPARPPDLLHAGPQQPAGAAHVLVDAAQLERGVVQRRVRAAGDGQAVVPGVDPQEPHHRADGRVRESVGQPEAQVALVPGHGGLRRGRVDHHVREPDRDGLALLDPPVRASRDV
jgi:hypothetical protein